MCSLSYNIYDVFLKYIRNTVKKVQLGYLSHFDFNYIKLTLKMS